MSDPPGNFPLRVDVGALSARIASLKGHPRGRLCFVNRFSAKSEKLFPVFGSGIPFFRIGAWKALVIT